MEIIKKFNDERVTKKPEDLFVNIIRNFVYEDKRIPDTDCFVFLNEFDNKKNTPYDQLTQLMREVSILLKNEIKLLMVGKNIPLIYKVYRKQPLVQFNIEEYTFSNGKCFILSFYSERKLLGKYKMCFGMQNIDNISDSGINSNDKEIVIIPDFHKNNEEKIIKTLVAFKQYENFKSISADFKMIINVSNKPSISYRLPYEKFIERIKEMTDSLILKIDQICYGDLEKRLTVINTENIYEEISKTFNYDNIDKNIVTVIVYHSCYRPSAVFNMFKYVDQKYNLGLEVQEEYNTVVDRLMEFNNYHIPSDEKIKMPSSEFIRTNYDYDKLEMTQYKYDYILISIDQFIAYFKHLLNISDSSTNVWGIPIQHVNDYDLVNLVLLDGIDETAFVKKSKNASDRLKIYKFNEVE